MASSSSGPIFPLVIEEYLAAGDERFLDALRQFHDPKRLISIVEKWKRDHRPWAREQIVKYLALPLNVINHQPVVKRLFKQAEAQQDDELMATFTVVFDRLVRRDKRTRHHYDWQTRQSWQEDYLRTPRDTIRTGIEKVRPELSRYFASRRLFSYHTRYYLRRRAWRYYRRMGFQRPDEYPRAIALALRQYADDDLRTGANLIDSWSLLHACFGDSEILRFDATHPHVKDGHSLSELKPAPYFPELWRKPASAQVLVNLLIDAQSRAVRVWAIELLRTDHRENLTSLSVEVLLRLLDHSDEQIQQFAAELLDSAIGLDNLPLATWLQFLQTRNVNALEAIAAAMRKHVPADKLTLEQAVDLGIAKAVPVARLGLDYLRQMSITTLEDRQHVARLGLAQSQGVGAEIAVFALRVLGASEHYDVEQVSPFFDSLVTSVRRGAWDWLAAERSATASRAYNDPALWSRLIESPFDDVRHRLIAELEHRVTLPGTGVDRLSGVWAAVLLNIHRGGRAKLAALRETSAAVAREPNHAQSLLPVLAVAIRSVRPAEARAGIAAIVRAVERHPPLAESVSWLFPDLQLGEPLITDAALAAGGAAP